MTFRLFTSQQLSQQSITNGY